MLWMCCDKGNITGKMNKLIQTAPDLSNTWHIEVITKTGTHHQNMYKKPCIQFWNIPSNGTEDTKD